MSHVMNYEEKSDYDECPKSIVKEICNVLFPSLPSSMFDSGGNQCYCIKCHTQRGDKNIYFRGKPRKKYGLPIGWIRLGLKVDDGFCAMNNVWKEWHVAFHGTKKEIVPKIFAAKLQLLKPGDITVDDKELIILDGHIKQPFKRKNNYTNKQELFDPNQIYCSPSIKYAAHPLYAKWFECKEYKSVHIQIAFQLRIKPVSYGIGQETVGATKKGNIIDGNFNNNELEWYTKQNITGIILTGLLFNINNNKRYSMPIKHVVQLNNEERRRALQDERRKFEKARKKLEDERRKKAEDEEKERKKWEDRRRKIEQMKAEERERRQKEKDKGYGDDDTDDDDDDTDDDDDDYNKKRPKPKGRRKRDEPKAPKKDYKIFFSVNIKTDENDEDIIGNTKALRPLLADLFETRSEKDVFEIKTHKNGNGFKIDIGIIIATSMHPADYIDTFDHLTMDGSFQETIKDGFDLDKDPEVHIWEGRYEKIDPKKRKKRKN